MGLSTASDSPSIPGRTEAGRNGKQANCVGFKCLPRLIVAPLALVSLFLNGNQSPASPASGLFGGTADTVRPHHTPYRFILQPSLQLPTYEWISFPGVFRASRAYPVCRRAGQMF